MLDENNKYNLPALKAKVNEILATEKPAAHDQHPAHNPTTTASVKKTCRALSTSSKKRLQVR
ncbi:MAG: hypothetical protein ACLRXQ_09530 [Phascolarctobacterium faecium]